MKAKNSNWEHFPGFNLIKAAWDGSSEFQFWNPNACMDLSYALWPRDLGDVTSCILVSLSVKDGQ